MFSTNSSPVQPQQNETILISKTFLILPFSPLLVATIFHLVFFSNDSIAMAKLRKASGAAVTAFIAYYVGFADLAAVDGTCKCGLGVWAIWHV
jgi:hypothetical protein